MPKEFKRVIYGEVVDRLVKETGLKREQVLEVMYCFQDIVESAMLENLEVEFGSLGTFKPIIAKPSNRGKKNFYKDVYFDISFRSKNQTEKLLKDLSDIGMVELEEIYADEKNRLKHRIKILEQQIDELKKAAEAV